jgi:holo-[acyl-carrier protein] synthase
MAGGVAALADRLGVGTAHLSISHDGDIASAVVVLEG